MIACPLPLLPYVIQRVFLVNSLNASLSITRTLHRFSAEPFYKCHCNLWSFRLFSYCSRDGILRWPLSDAVWGEYLSWLDDLLSRTTLHPSSAVHMSNRAAQQRILSKTATCRKECIAVIILSNVAKNNHGPKRKWPILHITMAEEEFHSDALFFLWWTKQQRCWHQLSSLSLFQWDVFWRQSHLHDRTWRTGKQQCEYSTLKCMYTADVLSIPPSFMLSYPARFVVISVLRYCYLIFAYNM